MKSKNQQFWDETYTAGKDYSDLSEAQMEIIFKNTDSGSHLLDIGAGTGKLLKIAEGKNINSKGVEVSEVAITKAKERGISSEMVLLDTEMIEEYIDTNKYSKIVLKLVIAFIKNKINLLCWIKQHLTNDGELIIITPTISKENQFKVPGIAINQKELERSLNFIFGNFEIKDVMGTPNGNIFTYVCRD